MTTTASSIYPTHPRGSRVIYTTPENALTALDRFTVATSSLIVIGSVWWGPPFLAWLYRRWRRIADPHRKKIFGAIIVSVLTFLAIGPHRSPKVGEWLKFRESSIWNSLTRYMALEVVADNANLDVDQFQTKQNIMAFIPHGIFPFTIAMASLPEIGRKIFGKARLVVAAATGYFPLVRSLVGWADSA